MEIRDIMVITMMNMTVMIDVIVIMRILMIIKRTENNHMLYLYALKPFDQFMITSSGHLFKLIFGVIAKRKRSQKS